MELVLNLSNLTVERGCPSLESVYGVKVVTDSLAVPYAVSFLWVGLLALLLLVFWVFFCDRFPGRFTVPVIWLLSFVVGGCFGLAIFVLTYIV